MNRSNGNSKHGLHQDHNRRIQNIVNQHRLDIMCIKDNLAIVECCNEAIVDPIVEKVEVIVPIKVDSIPKFRKVRSEYIKIPHWH